MPPSRLLLFSLGLCAGLGKAEGQVAGDRAPQPRPRLTEALRAKVEEAAPAPSTSRPVTMDRFVVRERPLPEGPPKEVERDGPFSATQGGYLLKHTGGAFSTEVGLWRHIDIMDDPREALRQSTRIRMSFLRFSW